MLRGLGHACVEDLGRCCGSRCSRSFFILAPSVSESGGPLSTVLANGEEHAGPGAADKSLAVLLSEAVDLLT